MRLREEGDDNFVHPLCMWRGHPRPRQLVFDLLVSIRLIGLRRINQFAEYRASRPEIMLQPQHRRGDRTSLGSSQPNDANASAAGRCGYRDDGVVEVHALGLSL